MSTYREVSLKTKDNQQVIPFILKDTTPVKNSSNPITSGAVESLRTKFLTLSIPFLGLELSDKKLHLMVACTPSDNPVSVDDIDELYLDTANNQNNLVKTFTGTTWEAMSAEGFSQSQVGQRVLVDVANVSYDDYIYYSWYYVQDTMPVVVTPWVSTCLTATAGIPKHSELQDRNAPDAHSIEAITGLADVLNRKYQEVEILTDEQMADVEVAEGKIITFVGYSDGTTSGALVMRYKDANGNFGSLVPGITATLTGTNLSLATGNATNVAEDLDIYVTNDTLTVE